MAWLVVALLLWAGSAPLGHDEAQYAIAAREALAGAPPRWFYLSVGMNLLAAPGIWLGASEQALRMVPLVFGLGFVLATYAVGRRTVGALGAALALWVLASSRTIARLGTDLLSDMPAAACLLAAVAVFVGEIDREDGPRWRLLLAAPLLAAALYIRYGSALYIAVVVVATLAIGARPLVRRPLPAVTTAALFLALLVPHLVQAHAMTGSPLGILLASRGVPQQAHLADGLFTYLGSDPFRYYGLAAPPALLAGLIALRGADRRRRLVWVIGVGSFLAMSLTTHGMLRYILFPVALLIVLGAGQLVELAQRLPVRTRRRLAIGVGIALAYVWAGIARRAVRADEYREHRLRGTLAAAPVIRRDAAAAPCTVLGYHYTQLEWYSGCQAPLVMDAAAVREAHARGDRVYAVRDHTPTWVPAWKPVFAELPGAVELLLATADVEVARLAPR